MGAVYPGAVCLKQCVPQSTSHAVEHFAKSWLVSSTSPAVRKQVWDKVGSASFDKLLEVLANEMSDKGGNVQVVANVVRSVKNKGNSQKSNSTGRSEPQRTPPVWTNAESRRDLPAPAVGVCSPAWRANPHHMRIQSLSTECSISL